MAGTAVIDLRVHSLTAVKKAAYRFGARCGVSISVVDEHFVHVTLRSKDLLLRPDDLVGDFEREVLDQDLREEIARQTESVRGLIIAHALSNSALLATEGEQADFEEDPLGISNPDAPLQSNED